MVFRLLIIFASLFHWAFSFIPKNPSKFVSARLLFLHFFSTCVSVSSECLHHLHFGSLCLYAWLFFVCSLLALAIMIFLTWALERSSIYSFLYAMSSLLFNIFSIY